MLLTHQFLIILQHFTIIYALEIVGEKLATQNISFVCDFELKTIKKQKTQ